MVALLLINLATLVYFYFDVLNQLPSVSNNSNYYVFVFENKYKVS